MNHRKKEHSDTVAFCRNYREGKCNYADDMCWWNHEKKKEENIKCYFCNNIFESKSQLMAHRKKEHQQSVKPCNQFRENTCRFKDDTCWFKHVLENKDSDEEDTSRNNTNTASGSVFQKASEKLEPPLKNPKKNQE